ncbi:hypothetical protein GGF46_000198 [Coemansia sp. RSA 552]|nr:hypothetical protein GGF46_000198 [Coemansia sp. RSA 552]
MSRAEQAGGTTRHKLQAPLAGSPLTLPCPPSSAGGAGRPYGSIKTPPTALKPRMFSEMHAADQYYRRHSLDMGASAAAAAAAAAERRASQAGISRVHPLSLGRGMKRSSSRTSSESESEADDAACGRPRGGVATAEKPYACDQCELTFSRQHNLKSHALTHSTERPYACAVCQTPFRRQHDLKRHMKLHTGEKPYACTNCGRSFARLDALNRHMRAENFHACSQAAKRARTGDRGFVPEQRRASHNPAQNQAGPPPWPQHWTHRPSMAADEAMVRRMHERFGGGPLPHPPQGQFGASSPSRPAASAGNNAGFGSPDPRAYHQHHQHHHTSAAPQPPVTAPQFGGPPGSALRQPPPAPVSAGGGAKSPGRGEFARFASAVRNSPADHVYHYGPATSLPPPLPQNSRSGPIADSFPSGGGPARPGLALDAFSASSSTIQRTSLAPAPPVRLPPIELAPPRRHSLAVTTHLERYRSRDATPPPPASAAAGQQQQQQSQPMPQQEPGAPTKSSVTPQQTMAPVPEEDDIPEEPARPAPRSLAPTAAAASQAQHLAQPPPDTRRSSIIALTNPQTEEDVRAENAMLKRRLDEMEAKYMKEVERLNGSIRELEIEKSLLKSVLLEKGASLPGSPMQPNTADLKPNGIAPHSAPNMYKSFTPPGTER